MVTPVEQVVLDPSEVNPARTELDLTWVLDVSGIDWGEAGIVTQVVETKWGEEQISHRIPGRTITIPFVLKDVPEEGVDYETIRQQIQAKFAMWQGEGGSIKRVLGDGRVLFIDCFGGLWTPGDQWMSAHRDAEPGAKWMITAEPDFYGPEEEVAFTQDAKGTALLDPVDGDYPARSRIVVANPVVTAQRGLLLALRSRYYSAHPNAAVRYEAEDLTPSGSSAPFTTPGASGGETMRRTGVGTSWTDMLDTRLVADSSDLIHEGAYRVYARVVTTDTALEVRLLWGLGDMTLVEENEAKTVPDNDVYFLMDLGQVLLYPLPVGTHTWRGKIQAKGSAAGKTVYIDELWFVNVDEGWVYVETETAGDSVLPGFGTSEFRWDGNYRADTRYGRLPDAQGDQLRIPPAGLEGRQAELLVRSTRGRVDEETESDLDVMTVEEIFVRPCWVQVPGT